MGRKGLIILALLVAGLGTAYYFQHQAARPQPASVTDELLLPGLKGTLAEVTAVDVMIPERPRMRLQRAADGWVVPAKADYPAAGQPLSALLRGLSETRKVEAKTASPQLHGRVGLADKGSASEQGTRVRLERGAEPPLELLVGNPSKQGSGQLVRLFGDNQVWLIDQNLNLPTSEVGWLDRRVASVPFSMVRQVDVRYPNGSRLTVYREAVDQPNLKLRQLPKGRRLAYETAANGMATLFADLVFADAAPLAQGQFKGKPLLRFNLQTFDEGVLCGAIYLQGEQHWLVIKAKKKLSDELVPGRTDWAYRIEPTQYQALAKKLEDMLAKK